MATPLSLQTGVALRPSTGLSLRQPAKAPLRSRRVVAPKAIAETSIIISGATAASLALGRFVFLPFQRDNVKRQGLGRQNGETYAESGDKFAEEASFALKTNDPAGFNFVDVMAWGAIGHAIGYFILATTSLNNSGFNPKPF